MTTIKLYRYQSMDDCEFGRGPSYLLSKRILDSNQWYDEERYILPDGYTVAAGNDGHPHVYDVKNRYVAIVTTRSGKPALLLNDEPYRWLGLAPADDDAGDRGRC